MSGHHWFANLELNRRLEQGGIAAVCQQSVRLAPDSRVHTYPTDAEEQEGRAKAEYLLCSQIGPISQVWHHIGPLQWLMGGGPAGSFCWLLRQRPRPIICSRGHNTVVGLIPTPSGRVPAHRTPRGKHEANKASKWRPTLAYFPAHCWEFSTGPATLLTVSMGV